MDDIRESGEYDYGKYLVWELPGYMFGLLGISLDVFKFTDLGRKYRW